MAQNKQPNENAKGVAVKAFFKKNIYIILMIVCILAIGTMITVAAVVNAKKDDVGPPIAEVPNDIEKPVEKPDPPVDKPIEKPDPPVDKPVEKPDPPKFQFIAKSPVGGNVVLGKVFDSTKLVFNESLGYYSTHEATDFVVAEGTVVTSVFDGKVVAIERGAIDCTKVEIEHEGGFRSVYKLIDGVSLKVGDTIKQGEKIGEVTIKGMSEKADGAHLHFELLKDGVLVDVMTYMKDGPK